MRRSIAWQFRHTAGNESESGRGNERLERDPSHADRSLLVDDLDVALDQDPQEIAVTPELTQVERGPSFRGTNSQRRPFAGSGREGRTCQCVSIGEGDGCFRIQNRNFKMGPLKRKWAGRLGPAQDN